MIGLATVKILADSLRNHGFRDVWVDRNNLGIGCDMKEEVWKQIAALSFGLLCYGSLPQLPGQNHRPK